MNEMRIRRHPDARRRTAATIFLIVMGSMATVGADMATLMTRLDLDRPEMSAVKQAADNADLTTAAAALLEHFRTRNTPKWYTEPPPAPESRRQTEDPAAEKILRREYRFVGKPATLTPDIDWNANPLRDHEWPIELNRHYTWVRLVDAYNRTGNPAYANDMIAQLRDWCADNPRPPSPRQARYTWRTLECGIRLSGSWPRCFIGLLNSPHFTPDVLCLMLEAIWQQADYLTQFHGGGNWLVTETAGLMTTGVLFPEFAEAGNWRETAFSRLEHEIDHQVLPDGAQVELTPHYHSVTLGGFLGASRIARFNGIEIPENVSEGISRMAHYLMDIAKPDLHIPMFNDSDHDSLLRRLRPFANEENPHIQYVVSRGEEGVAPPYTSVALPYAGQYIMRSGWGPRDLYLAMDAGPYGYGHQHEDKLQIDVHAFGRSHILDPGRFTYAGGPWRHYFLTTQSHSTMLVNGRGQNRRRTPRRRWISRRPQDNLWITNDTFDVAVGVYNEGYGNGLHDVTHIRKVFFKRGKYWLVHDLLVGPPHANDAYAAAVQYQFAVAGVSVSDDGTTIRSHNDDANLALLPRSDRPLTVELHEGEEEPPKAWIGWSLHKALKTPATMAVIRQKQTLPIRIDTLMMPYRGPDLPQIDIRPLPENDVAQSAFEIVGPDWRDVYRCSHQPGRQDHPAIEWVRYDRQGNEQQRTAYRSTPPAENNGPDTPQRDRPVLRVEPALRGLEVIVPATGNLVLDYGFHQGGGYLFHREQQVEPGRHVLNLPSIRAGQAYVYAVTLLGTGGSRWSHQGLFAPEPATVHDFEANELGEWSQGTIVAEEDTHFLRAKAKADTTPVYVTLKHPLPRLRASRVSVSLRCRMPFSPGGDWCYGKVNLSDAQDRHWSAYVTDRPHDDWRDLRLQREDFRRDDYGEGGNTVMPPDVILTTLAVTVRKGKTDEPVAPILDIDDVSWVTDK